jgi:hypothetical protein
MVGKIVKTLTLIWENQTKRILEVKEVQKIKQN